LGIVDSQSVKTADKTDEKGFDGGKQIKGRKRQILVDTLGMLMGVFVHPANESDQKGFKKLIGKVKHKSERMVKVIVDGGYQGEPLREWLEQATGWILEVMKRSDTSKFEIMSKRWIVERTFGWLLRYRRLRSDYEYKTQTVEGMIYLGMIRLMLHRLSGRNYSPIRYRQVFCLDPL
jgi:putative transposase